MENKKMTIVDALMVKSTIQNDKARLINENDVELKDYAAWIITLKNAHDVFYNYMRWQSKAARPLGEEIPQEVTTAAYDMLQEIIDLIGNVNGIPLVKNAALLERCARTAIKVKKDVVGEALTAKSVRDNLYKEVKNIHTGMEEEYVKDINRRYEKAKVIYDTLCKDTYSAELYEERVKFNPFRIELEKVLALTVNGQAAKSLEQIYAEEAARKAARAEARKEARKAKKAKTEANA